MKKPTKSEIDHLVQAFGRYIGSGKYRPSIQTQQRLYNIYTKVLTKLQKKYPHVDMESEIFQEHLTARAESWWNNKAVAGSSVDW